MQHRRDFLSRRWRRVQHATSNGHERREELRYDDRKVILDLTIPTPPRQRCAHQERLNEPSAHLNARTHSSAATQPAPTSRISPLVNNAFTLSSNPSQRSGKSCETRSLRVAPSWTVIVLEGETASNRKMADFNASRSDGAIGTCSGRVPGASRV